MAENGRVVETLWLMGMSPYFGTPCEYNEGCGY